MVANERLRARGRRRAARTLPDQATEFRYVRVEAGVSQRELGRRLGMSADKVWRIENERQRSLSIVDACEMAAVLGLDWSARAYPNGATIRDAGQARRLLPIIAAVADPLTYRTDVALPRTDDAPELRAWDVVVYGNDERTGIELESRLTDTQATVRRINLKRRDDPVDHFILAIADTKHNRRVMAEFASLFADLPRLRTASVLKALRQGRHPPTGIILV
jgi:transcriptional regulator with XRE-family HTH domain